ncbi:major facilitator superfamily domain-containing protein [Rhizoctonia solani]|nr:major facilitator superfamily domain-containing protein [Rhizoctonia solani]
MTSRLVQPTAIFPSHSGTGRSPLYKSSINFHVEPSVSPLQTLQHRHDHEAVEMSTLRDGVAATSGSTIQAPEVPAWTMSLRNEWIAISACCECMFLGGWNDATTGPLLPTIQNYYQVGFVVVSMLFVSSFVGFISAAVLNIHLSDRLGFGKVILSGGVLQVLAYSVLSPAPPFPVLCIAYFLNGFGRALQNAQANGFIAQLPNNPSSKMGLLHATYGIGAFIAPLVATQFAQLPRWSFHYLCSLGIALLNSSVLLFVFKLRRLHEVTGAPETNVGLLQNEGSKYKDIFSSRAVQLLALFAWVYVGTEVTIGGWIVTFIVEVRGGGASAGYITSGFFGGLTLGRVVFLWVNKKVGEHRMIYIYCLLAIGLELVVWLVPDIIGDALAVSFVGLLLGPMYPIVIHMTSNVVPRRILTGSIGWIASFGQAGSAAFPFMTGALAQKYGVKVLQPLLIGMMSALIVIWTMAPTSPQRRGD